MRESTLHVLVCVYALREVLRVQLYKNNALVRLLQVLSIVNSDWLQHARSLRGMYD